MRTVLLLTVLLLSIFQNRYVDNPWVLQKRINNFSLYSSKRNSSHIKSIRVIGDLKCSKVALEKLLFNIDSLKTWTYGTQKAYVVCTLRPQEIIYYSEIGLPWPFSNRDLALHLKKEDVNNSHCKLVYEAIPDAVPEKDGIVRVKEYQCTWDINEIARDSVHYDTRVTLKSEMPIPNWVFNMYGLTGPIKTFSKLKQKLES